MNAYTWFYKGYEKGLAWLLKKYGGSLLTLDDSAETLKASHHARWEWLFLVFHQSKRRKIGMQMLIIKLYPSTKEVVHG